MSQKILIAFDDSENAFRAVDFVTRSFGRDSQVTLFSVIQNTAAICEMDSPELTEYFKSQQTAFCTLEDKKKEIVRQSLEKAKANMVSAGFNADNVSIKIQTKQKGIARDIIEQSKDGYDTVVLGRHGNSGIKDFFLGSISQKVINSVKGVSVLIAD